MINCTTCGHCESLGFVCSMRLPFVDIKDIKSCSNYVPKPMTNGDRIRAMTDEELAWVFHIVAHCEDWGSCERCIFRSLDSCVEKDILEWLQQPVKGDAE